MGTKCGTIVLQKLTTGAFCNTIVLHLATISSKTIWPASREKGPSDITNSADQDRPLHGVENNIYISNQIVYTARIYFPLMYEVLKSADPDQTLRRRRGGWSGSTLFAYVRGPFSRDAGHFMILVTGLSDCDDTKKHS